MELESGNYPPRVDGQDRRSLLHLFLTTDGEPGVRMIAGSSGVCELDLAALEVARVMRFDPAMNDGERIRAWVSIPVRWAPR